MNATPSPLLCPPALPQPGLPSQVPAGAAELRPRWQSAQLLGASREVEIVHGDQVYRLRHTALGKLILTK